MAVTLDDAMLRRRLWEGFARLQAILGRHASHGTVLEEHGIVASFVPDQADSPALNAAVVLDPDAALPQLDGLLARYEQLNVRRWGTWVDAKDARTARHLQRRGLSVTTSSPGMGATLLELDVDPQDAEQATAPDLATVGRINDAAYGNLDGRLARTLAALPPTALQTYAVHDTGEDAITTTPAACALALHHEGDCSISFVATAPEARRRGLASRVMRAVFADAARRGCTTVSLQATPQGQRLYDRLGLRRVGTMELWERR